MKILQSFSLLSLLFFSVTPTAPIDTPEQSNQVSLDENAITPEQLKLALAFFEQEAISQKRKAKSFMKKSFLWLLYPAYFTCSTLTSKDEKIDYFTFIGSVSVFLYTLGQWAAALDNEKRSSDKTFMLEKALFDTKTWATYKSKNLNSKAISSKVVGYLTHKLIAYKETPPQNLCFCCVSIACALSSLGFAFHNLTSDNPSLRRVASAALFTIFWAFLSIDHGKRSKISRRNLKRMLQELNVINDLIGKSKISIEVLLKLADGFGKHNLEPHLTELASE